MLPSNDVTKLKEIKKLLESSLTKMINTLEDNLLYYNVTYLLAGILIILAVKPGSH